MLRSKKVATPPTAATGVVPLSAPPPGLAPSAMLTLPVNPGTTFPSASSARTFTAGLLGRPAIVVPGGVPTTSCVAVPAVIVKELLVVELNPARSEERPSPLQSSDQLGWLLVATPPTAAHVVVPPQVL